MESMKEILVLKGCSGSLQVTTISVEDSSYIINQIEKAVENENMNLMDVQDIFINNFRNNYRIGENFYPYMYPYRYSWPYISGSCKPKIYSYDEYELKLDKKVDEISEIPVNQGVDRTILYKRANMGLKEIYAENCCRYIQHQMIFNAYKKANDNPTVKMYSTDIIGWNNHEFNITDDLKACLYTNFGYGCASYFTLIISYKDIIIAPYSHIVKYYKANMTDIIKCTRAYYVERDSWHHALNFVKDFANESVTDPASFVEKYLINEIDVMMSGLRNIMENPDAVITMFKSQDTTLSDYHNLRLISPMSKDEKERFDVFPSEMPVIFKSEKLTQATSMLERLRELGKIYGKINTYINEIENMVLRLSPEILKTQDNIHKDIVLLTSQKEEIENRKSIFEERAAPFDAEFNQLKQNLPNGSLFRDFINLRDKYEEEHPEYTKIKEQIRECKNSISDLNNKINSRSRLISRLAECTKALKIYELPKAA